MNIRFNLYTKADIKNWQHQLTQIPLDIEALKTEIAKIEESRKQETKALADIQTVLAPFNAKIKALEAQLTFLENNQRIPQLEDEMKKNKKSYQTYDLLVQETHTNIRRIKSEIKTLETLQSIHRAQAAVDDHPDFIRAAEKKISSMESALIAERQKHDNLIKEMSTIETSLEKEKKIEKKYQERLRQEEEKAKAIQTDKQTTLQRGAGAFPGIIMVGSEPVFSDIRKAHIAELEDSIGHGKSALKECQITIEQLSSDIQDTKMKIEKLNRELIKNRRFLLDSGASLVSDAKSFTSHTLSSQLDTNQKELQDLLKNLRELESIANGYLRQAGKDSSNINTLKHQNQQLQITAAEHANNNDVEDLHKKLSLVLEECRPHRDIEATHLNALDSLKKETDAKHNAIHNLSNQFHILNNRDFLFELRDFPLTATGKLSSICEKAFQRFFDNHPVNQSLSDRLCLAEMKKDIRYIKQRSLEDFEPGEVKNEDGLVANIERTRAYELAGMVLSKIELLVQEDKNSPLAAELTTAIAEFPVDGRADYKRLNRPLMTSNDLIQEVFENYANASNSVKLAAESYRSDNAPCRNLSNAALELVTRIEANKLDVRFDAAYYTQLLNEAENILSNNADTKRFAALMAHDPIGKTNKPKCILGGLTLFLGTASTVASLLLPSAPAKRGMGLFAGVSAMAHGGWTLFSGRATGSVAASYQFCEAANQIPECYKLPAAPKPNFFNLRQTVTEPSAPPAETLGSNNG